MPRSWDLRVPSSTSKRSPLRSPLKRRQKRSTSARASRRGRQSDLPMTGLVVAHLLMSVCLVASDSHRGSACLRRRSIELSPPASPASRLPEALPWPEAYDAALSVSKLRRGVLAYSSGLSPERIQRLFHFFDRRGVTSQERPDSPDDCTRLTSFGDGGLAISPMLRVRMPGCARCPRPSWGRSTCRRASCIGRSALPPIGKACPYGSWHRTWARCSSRPAGCRS